MCKTCVVVADIVELTVCISLKFYTAVYRQCSALRTTARFTLLYTCISIIVMNIKTSLNLSVNAWLSTVSTVPIIRTTRLNFNESIII